MIVVNVVGEHSTVSYQFLNRDCHPCVCVWLLKQLNTLRRKAAILNAHKPGAQGKRST